MQHEHEREHDQDNEQDRDSGAEDDAPAPVVAEPSFGAWFAGRRAKIEILLIGGIAIGGIVCMMLVVVYALWLNRQP